MADLLFKIPNALIYQGDSKNWKKFKQQFDIYMKASGLEKNDSENKVNIFLNIAGEEALEIFENLNLSPDEKKDYDTVIDAFENHCMSKHNEIYKSFKFFTRVQQPSEYFSEFYDDLLVMASFCNFGNQKDRLIRDRIIAGIRSPELQEKFLKSPDLSLGEVVNICLDNEVEKINSGHFKSEKDEAIPEERNIDEESNNNYDDELPTMDTSAVSLNSLEQMHIPNEILFNDMVTEGYDEEMNLSELESDVDVPDVKPIDVSLVNIQSKADSKKEKFPVSNELACESNEVSSTTSRINDEPNEGRRRKSSRNCNKGTSLKVAEVKKKLTRSIEKEADNKLTRIQRKKTRSGLKEELKKEPFEDCDDSFLECYSVPVEDQDEYSEIVHDQDEYSEAVNEEFQLSSLVECDSGEVVVEDQDEYSQIENENSELSSLMEYERDEMEVEDQDEYSQISHEGSEISLIEYEKETEESDNSQNRFEFENTDTHIGVMNEMAEAEYMLETNTTISSSPKKKRITRRKKKKPSKGLKATEPKIIKVKRDNLPPLILKSVRKKTLLLGKMPFACKKCDATFWTSFQLDKHQLVHVLKKVPAPSKPPSKVFKCEECGKEFKKICDLERHTRVHTGEKPSVCNICNKRFQQAYNLNKHLYTHTQEKNFECVICQKKFGRNDVLNRHVLTHSIVKPFRCSLCSKTFIRNSQLKLHLQKRHGLDEDPGSGASAVDDPVASTSATKS